MKKQNKTFNNATQNQPQTSKENNKTRPVQLTQLFYFGLLLLCGFLFFLIIHQLITEEQWIWYWKLVILYFIPPFGKESIIPAGLGITSSLGVGVPLPALLLGVTIWICDLLVCIGIITNWWILEFFINHIPAFPFLGIRRKKPRIYKTRVSLKIWYEKLHKKTQEIEQKKYGKILPVALFVFMFVPFQGTGAMSTTIIGTWLGLRKRETVLVVAIGSFLSILFIIAVSLGILKIIG
ncbi:MAG: small multi-drug export protein [Methanobacteriota archaeon]